MATSQDDGHVVSLPHSVNEHSSIRNSTNSIDDERLAWLKWGPILKRVALV